MSSTPSRTCSSLSRQMLAVPRGGRLHDLAERARPPRHVLDEGMMVLFFIGAGGAAIATGLIDGPVTLAIGLAAIGLFGSIYHPVGTAWLVRNARNRGRALGVNGIAGSVGLAVAAFVAGALAQAIGWRAAFIIPGALCATTGAVLLCCMRGRNVVVAAADHL